MPDSAPYQGVHLIADLHEASGLSDLPRVEQALRDGAVAAGATVLKVILHHFGPGQGVTGVALLAESHMSIHTWPEHDYAAIDIFVCGARNDAGAGLQAIAKGLGAARIESRRLSRGYAAG
jgi:S-adenosylmethionine decarboxylase